MYETPFRKFGHICRFTRINQWIQQTAADSHSIMIILRTHVNFIMGFNISYVNLSIHDK